MKQQKRKRRMSDTVGTIGGYRSPQGEMADREQKGKRVNGHYKG